LEPSASYVPGNNQPAVVFLEFPPSAALSPFVERLWVLGTDADAEPEVSPVLPDGHVEMIVHLGTPFSQVQRDGTLHRQARVVLGGQLTAAIRLVSAPGALMVGVRMRPQAGATCTGIPQNTLLDDVHDVRTLDAPFAERLEADLRGRTDPADIAAACDDALVREWKDRLVPAGPDRAVRAAEAAGGLLKVDDLSAAAGVSARQLERLFAHHVGLSPKAFLRVLRFQQVLAALRGQTSPEWADLAVRHGYYDQAHFINDFRRFTGESPGAWAIDDDSLTALFAARDQVV
jgi:AraC-like DNA-binding protein